MIGLVCMISAKESQHVRVEVRRRRRERLLDRARRRPPLQVLRRPGLVVRPGRPRPAERLLPLHRAGRLVVDVEVSRGVPQPLRGVRDRRPVLRDDRGTYARDAAEHFWPWYSKAPLTMAVDSTSRSAEGCASTKSLPPVSPTMRG